MLSPSLHERIESLARVPRLLIASDFDGTLAPIVPRPADARGDPRAIELLLEASHLPQTCVAVISGRALADLRRRLPAFPSLWLVGGHGAEIDGPNLRRTPGDLTEVLDRAAQRIEELAPASAGYELERKPASLALHYRHADPAQSHQILNLVIEQVAQPMGLRARAGKLVLELLASGSDKGEGLTLVRQATGAQGVYFAGDDVTDEDAFACLTEKDLGVHIGQTPTQPPTHFTTRAHLSVPCIEDSLALLAALVRARTQWSRQREVFALQECSVLSDMRTMAIVTPRASIAWLSLPRVDGPAVFSALLDGPRVGSWDIEPVGGSPVLEQRSEPDSLVLRTRWEGMQVTDYLDGSGGRVFQRAGRSDLIRVLEGHGLIRVTFTPRLDFGRIATSLLQREGGLIIEGSSDMLVLVSPGVAWTLTTGTQGDVATAEFELSGEPVVLELRCGTRSLMPSSVPEGHRRAQTNARWAGWASSLRLPSERSELCKRSALMLRSLCHGPTGSMLAAGTTSLPETFGGVRNWDYRFCWPRDAAIACASLVRLGNTGVAMRYLEWLLGVLDRCPGPEFLRPIYTVTGTELGSEAELSHLSGYRESWPVRLGNAAAQQVQLDVFGPIVELVSMLVEGGAAIAPEHVRLVEAMATAVERRWMEPDHGIWEVRAQRQHHVHSKVMCWLCLDRAARIAQSVLDSPREHWEHLRDRIRDEVLERGFHAPSNAFVSAYGVHEPDAATLLTGLTGMVAPDDPRFVGTVDLVQRELLDRGTVLRYRFEDGLPGLEGGFHICTGWLIRSLLLIGRVGEARELFGRLCAGAGATGTMTEQWCPLEQTGMGNLPQAYSHSAIIDCACALDGATTTHTNTHG